MHDIPDKKIKNLDRVLCERLEKFIKQHKSKETHTYGPIYEKSGCAVAAFKSF